MIGGGQLARMSHQAAIGLGQSLRVLASSPDESAAQVSPTVSIGSHTDRSAVLEFAAACDVVTFDHEHVPGELIEAMTAAGHAVYPGAAALRFAQDKSAMRTRLAELDIPVPRWRDLSMSKDLRADLQMFGDDVGWPVVLKAIRGGYDGRGVWKIESVAAAAEIIASGTELLVEENVQLIRELAAVVARSPYGQGAAYPVVQTVQRDGICVEVIAPAPDVDRHIAEGVQELALKLAAQLDVVGLLAVELFQTDAGVLVNELAMRPHNSGHWTIEGARTSQFEQHLRAVLDYPLGPTTATARWTVMANVLGGADTASTGSTDERLHHLFARWPDVKVHLYGKAPRPGRKLGHVTACGDDLSQLRAHATAAATYLGGVG